MASLGDLVVKIGADTRNLNKQLGKVQREFRSMTGNITRLGQNLTRSLTVPLAAMGAAAVKSAADLETLETSFISLTGGAEQARDMVEQLNKFTAETPFQLEQVGKAARQLIASGTAVDEVNDKLQFLGDIAATSGSSIDEIAAIFAKVNAKGKVELENLNQLAERGIPIFTALSDATGLLPSELGAGAVSVEQFNDTLRSFAQEGGFAEGAMLRLSQTAAGKFSTALDNLKLAGAELGDVMLPTINKLLTKITDLAKQFTEMDDSVKQVIVRLGLVASTIGPGLLFLPQLIKQVRLLSAALAANPILAAAGIITAIGLALYDMEVAAKKATTSIEDLREQFSELDKTSREQKRADRAETIKQLLAYQELGEQFKRLEEQVEGEGFKRGSLGFINRLNPLLREMKSNFTDAEQEVYEFGRAFFGLNDTLAPIVARQESITDAIIEQQNEMAALTVAVVDQGSAVKETTTNAVQPYLETINKLGVTTIGTTKQTKELGRTVWNVGDFVDGTSKKFEDFAKSVQSAMETAAQNVAAAIGQMIGAMASGAYKAGDFVNSLLSVFSALATQLGMLAIGYGVAIEGIKEALKSLKGPLAIAAGVALVALGAGLQGAVNKRMDMAGVPALAEGGLATGPTMAIVGDNRNAAIDPEVISPLSKLKDMMGGSQVEVYGRISGNDIFLSNNRSGFKRNRYS